jgi:predicted adenine nucleotide alpha hydrolase (AANH) superfamily ATPase
MPMNYQRLLEEKLRELSRSGAVPTLLLHSCCGPCSSYVLEYLAQYFDITVFYYNPNIYPEAEFHKRAEVQRELLGKMALPRPVRLLVPDYEPDAFEKIAAGLEDEPEGGRRCLNCFELRLEEAAKAAAAGGYDCFTTTLSVSPHKNAEALNAIGAMMGEKYGVSYLYADFKKKNGYKRSIELSGQYGLYRQNYCGCRYSLRDTGRA